uniref:PDZ domain-containing protein n=1 Tax=Ditylenchus dipsaci TaxID=166011 RepID=A0A915D8F9_9BILA
MSPTSSQSSGGHNEHGSRFVLMENRGKTRFQHIGHGRWANVPVAENRNFQKNQMRTHSADHSEKSTGKVFSANKMSPMIPARKPMMTYVQPAVPPVPQARTGWQEIKHSNQSKSSDELWWSRRSNTSSARSTMDSEYNKTVENSTTSEENSEEKAAPRPVNDLIKQFAQMDKGLIPKPEEQRRAPKPLFHLSHQSSHESLPPYSSESAATSDIDSSELDNVTRQNIVSSWSKSIASPQSPLKFSRSADSGNESHFEYNKIPSITSTSNQVTVTTNSMQVYNTLMVETHKHANSLSQSYRSPVNRVEEQKIEKTGTLLSMNDKEAKLPAPTANNPSSTTTRKEAEERISSQQLDVIRECLGDEFHNHNVFAVSLKRASGIEDGSVGLILTSAMTTSLTTSYIVVQRVITGSIADQDNRLCKGDRIFFIQHRSTQKMSAPDARTVLKSPAPSVPLVVGRLIAASGSSLPSTLTNDGIFSTDPALEHYSKHPVMVTLMKSDIGIGFSIDGGRDSKYGDRPIVVKKIFSVGEAAKNGQISIGDELRSVDGINLSHMTHLEAWKTLKNRPEGPTQLVLYKRLVD